MALTFNLSGGPGFYVPSPPPADYSAYRWPIGNWRGRALVAMLTDAAARDYLLHLFCKREEYYRSVPLGVREWIAAKLGEA